MAAQRQNEASKDHEWISLSDEQLLDLRICDLKLRIPGTELNKCVRTIISGVAKSRVGFSTTYLVVGRLVFARWSAGTGCPVLYGASTSC